MANFLALREANDRLRQQGVDLLWDSLHLLSSRYNESVAADPLAHRLQLARQEWQFPVDESTMVGERFGLRCNFKTLVFELGWPRRPEHGHVPGSGLARGRIGFSQNVMLDPRPLAELILRRVESSDSLRWYFIDRERRRGDELSEAGLRPYLQQLLDPS
ncbi:MAG: hypothetical protein ACKOB4_04260 [Acidobacteriota bacterium]